jgi:hypothetical protein
MNDHIGVGDFFEGRAKRRHQGMRQTIDESYGVRHQHLAAIRQVHLANQRVECDEQRVGCLRSSTCQRIEQRGLSGIRIADQRDGRNRGFVPPLTKLRPALTDVFNLFRNRVDALSDAAPIRFQFRFAGTSRPNSAAQPRQGGTHPHQARQEVLQLGELDLQLAFLCARPPGKNVENQLRPVDHFPVNRILDLSQLRGCQLIVEYDHVDVHLGARRSQRHNLSGTQKGRRIGLGSLLQNAEDDNSAGRFGQACKLVEGTLGIRSPDPSGNETDERCPFGDRGFGRYFSKSQVEVSSLKSQPEVPQSRVESKLQTSDFRLQTSKFLVLPPRR